jgi:hypothetical protein
MHRNENGSIAFIATLRYFIARVLRFGPCNPDSVSGRALTPRERGL